MDIIESTRNFGKPEEDTTLNKVKRFLMLKRQIDDLSKEQGVLKTYLSELVDVEGEPDEKGHLFYPLPEEVDGYKSLQRQRRVSQKLDEAAAERILKEKGLETKCYQMLPVLDEAAVMAALYEGLLTEEEVDTMFPKTETWAFLPVKA
jgi:hypothetical protein